MITPMYTPKLEPDIGWIVEDASGNPYTEGGSVPTFFYRDDAQELADRLNREE